ncbi:hypothetical protein BDQ94DRAFT_38770 [Aspergillus welwitschiae]|uniref:Uncharacterized protein n=1 Tax=Aspergillus welwitschiae TaxID=1341132 RepID=A0A3F3Q0B3_9EURO|nr:hypothetical protein BDQ94DRAFT_38770 [Aspergillus welwitschiae]RDH32600.1 hypothetical protein BDQ94DRAFT_38770 [Aspergillus welwitschiae]
MQANPGVSTDTFSPSHVFSSPLSHFLFHRFPTLFPSIQYSFLAFSHCIQLPLRSHLMKKCAQCTHEPQHNSPGRLGAQFIPFMCLLA